jgi:hypothetical protein
MCTTYGWLANKIVQPRGPDFVIGESTEARVAMNMVVFTSVGRAPATRVHGARWRIIKIEPPWTMVELFLFDITYVR